MKNPIRAPGTDRTAARDGPGSGPPPAVHVLLSLATAGSLLLAAGPVGAQEPDSVRPGAGIDRPTLPESPSALGGDSLELIDRVVAVVDDTVILHTEVVEEILRRRTQGLTIPRDPSRYQELYRSTLEQLIQDALVLQKAKQLGLVVDPDQLDQMVEQRFQSIRGNFDSDEAMREAVERAGMNMFQYRQELREAARKELLKDRLRRYLIGNEMLPPATVSGEEIRAFFQERFASARRPATITFDRLLVPPVPTEAEQGRAHEEAREALREIREGTSFQVAARRYSDDPGTRERGGELGWVRRSEVVGSFAEAAWKAPPGRAVGPVETPFGFHIIKVENVRGGERQLRHILIRPEITDDDVGRAEELARALRDSLEAGADPRELAERHDLPDEQIHVEDVPLDDLGGSFGRAYRRALEGASAGEVIGPFRTEGAFGLPTFVVMGVREYREAGSYTLEDVRDRIREQLLLQKQLDEYVKRLRSQMHVEVYL